jgi:Dolichyl-phosphate-mannose-protein mannosyltransferase
VKKGFSLFHLLRQPRFWLMAILLMGAGLRLYHLGYTSFWVDEAGVAYAARMKTLPEMLQVVRSHVMAMPLDYLVVWLIGRFNTQEAVMRLPAAMWGILSLAVAYRLYRRFLSAPLALLGLLALALSPLHIQYSQELRFYSSLVFFYLISTLLLWDALQQPTMRRWTLFLIIHIIGIYFHPYVLFALVNGLTWMAFPPKKGPEAQILRTRFLACAIGSLLAFLTGYRTFSGGNFFQIPLMVFEPSPATALAIGLDWLPFATGAPGLSWGWGFLCATLEITGMLVTLRRTPRGPLAGLFYSLVLQIGAVIGSDLAGHYFFAPRQFLMLLPGLCLFAGIGIWEVTEWVANWLKKTARETDAAAIRQMVLSVSVLAMLLASQPAIALYQQDDKGNSRAISEQIVQAWQPGDTVLITPGVDGFVYQYYLKYVFARPLITERLWVASWEDVLKTGDWPGEIFIITPAHMTRQETAQMRALGLVASYQGYPLSRYAKTLWVREELAAR